MLTAISDSNCT